MKTAKLIAGLLFLILVNLSLILHLNPTQALPTIGDEYVHLSFARQLVEEGDLPFTNPYFLNGSPHNNYESGFHFLLAGLYKSFGSQLIYNYQLVVAGGFILNSLLFYYLAKLWSKRRRTALISMFIFGSITSTGGMLTHNYFLPVTIGVTLLLLFFIFWHRWYESNKSHYLWYLAGIFTVGIATYPPAAVFSLGVLACYILSNDHHLPERWNLSPKLFSRNIRILISAMTALYAGALFVIGGTSLLIFDRSWEISHITFSPLFYLGHITAVAFFFGVYVLLFSERRISRIPIYWLVFSVPLLYVDYVFHHSILLPFPRLFFFYLIGYTFIASVGVTHIFDKIRQSRIPLRRSISGFLLVCFIGTQYFYARAHLEPYQPTVTDYELAILQKHLTTSSNSAAVVADGNTSFAIYPLTGKFTGGVLNANIGGGDPKSSMTVLTGNCFAKKMALYDLATNPETNFQELETVYILSRQKLDCQFLNSVAYSGSYLYRLKANPPRFTLEEQARLLPKAPQTYNDIPDSVIADEEKFRNLLIGNTFFGDNWEEHYFADRTFTTSMSGDTFAGFWKITGPFYCYYNIPKQAGDCIMMGQDGSRITSYDPDGSVRKTYSWRAGH